MHRRSPKRGTATAELAICLPVIFFVVFGSIEASHSVFLKQTLREASYHGATMGTKVGADEATVETAVQNVLTARGINSTIVTVAGMGGEPFDGLVRGDRFRVTAQADIAANQLLPPLFFTNSNLDSSSVARKQ